MRDRHEPPTDPVPWSAYRPTHPAEGRTERFAGGDRYQDYPTRFDEPLGEIRTQGLRRLSKLTWRATQLSAVTAVGFAALFAHSAHASTTTTATKPSASRTPSPSSTKKKHHHHKAAGAAGTSTQTGGTATSPATAPSPTLAPPTTAPAPPPPSPTPVQSTSSGSGGG